MALSKIQNSSMADNTIHGRRNLVINGAMQVAQRGTSQTGVTNGANQGYQTVDRISTAGNSNGVFTMTQTADGPSGFANCLKLDCTTADTSIAASEYFLIEQKLEGQDLQQLKYNQSSAETSTISFYVKGNASAQYTFALQYHLSGGTARWFTKGFAVTSSWTRVVITIPGDTQASSGSDYGIADNSSTGANLMIWLHGGTNFSSGTHQDTAWANRDYTKLLQDNQTSFLDSTDRTFFITGLQMEVGSVATPFEHRSFGEELALCHRYYYQSKYGSAPTSGDLSFGPAPAPLYHNFPTSMRVDPTVTTKTDVDTGSGRYVVVGVGNYTNGDYIQAIKTRFAMRAPTALSHTSNRCSCGLIADAEL